MSCFDPKILGKMSGNSRPEMFYKIGVLENLAIFTGPVLESLFNKVAGLKVISCEHCECYKNSFFYRTPPVAASKCLK